MLANVNPMNKSKLIHLNTEIPQALAGTRLDSALAKLFPDYSRARLQHWIKTSKVLVDGKALKAKEKISAGQLIEIEAMLEAEVSWQAQAIDLNIVYEDDDLLVLNKPAGIVVHPGAGNPDHTLVNAILHHAPECELLPRAGMVHRIDKDTSGLLVIAKTLAAHTSLVQQIQEKQAKREYLALVDGLMIAGAHVDAAIGRHPTSRKKMAVRIDEGKPAITHYRIKEKFRAHTLLTVQLETGRTHQIRVHMAHIQHPIVGDQTYNKRLTIPKNASQALIDALRQFKRQALHAYRLSFTHPITAAPLSFEIAIAKDMENLIQLLRADQNANRNHSS